MGWCGGKIEGNRGCWWQNAETGSVRMGLTPVVEVITQRYKAVA